MQPHEHGVHRVAVQLVRFEVGLRAFRARDGGVEQRALLGARDLRTHAGGDVEFIECAQHGGARRAGLVAGRDEMRLRCFGRTAAVVRIRTAG